MLTPAVVAEIRQLLGEGRLSQRAIARHLGVSRGIVHAIAHGKRRDRPEPNGLAPKLAVWEGPWERCPGCGGKVQMPCLLCRVRAMRQRRNLNRCGRP